jgi:hypothetical protein
MDLWMVCFPDGTCKRNYLSKYTAQRFAAYFRRSGFSRPIRVVRQPR